MPSENPYWKLVYEDVLKQLPAPDNQMRAAGLPGRVFPAVGNHEVWDDTDVEGLLNAFPYLKQFGVSDKRLIYKLISTASVSSFCGPANTTIARRRRGMPPSPSTMRR
jgi:hypothetical protein